jgi:quercetin dioxygenase-like cupin family protein
MAVDPSTPWILRSRDQQPTWNLPKADTAGFWRGRCNGMEASQCSAGLVLMPFGQTTPLHSNCAEHIILLLEGEIEFTIEGEPFPLEPGDMLFIPADVKYLYTNRGRSTARFISILGRVDAWPPKGTYYD